MLPARYRKLVATGHSRDFRAVAEVVEVPLQHPGPGEVLIQNRHAGVNASDVNITSGLYLGHAAPPFDLGVEAVGEVVAVGEGVTHLAVGDAALTLYRGGGYREYQCVSAKQAFAAPAASRQVLGLGLSGLTASIGLEEIGGLRPVAEGAQRSTVLVTAAAGATGSFAVQLARRAGHHVIGTCGGPDKAALLAKLGCDRIIDHRAQSVDEALKAHYPDGVDLVYEGVGGALFDTCVAHLATRGTLLVVGYISEYDTGAQPITRPRIYEQLLWKSAQIRAFLVSHYPRCIPAHLANLLEALEAGQLQVPLEARDFQGVNSVCDAVEALHSGQTRGKVVVSF
mgnify:CR=1 FL=1